MSNANVSLLRQQLKMAHNWLEDTMADVTSDQAHWVPAGKPNPIGAQYAHVIFGEDFIINSVLGKSPLMMTAFAGKTGASELPPMGDWGAWAHQLKVDLPALRAYAKAVQANTDAILAEMTDEAVNKSVDASAFGMGTQPLTFMLNLQILNNFTRKVLARSA